MCGVRTGTPLLADPGRDVPEPGRDPGRRGAELGLLPAGGVGDGRIAPPVEGLLAALAWPLLPPNASPAEHGLSASPAMRGLPADPGLLNADDGL